MAVFAALVHMAGLAVVYMAVLAGTHSAAVVHLLLAVTALVDGAGKFCYYILNFFC